MNIPESYKKNLKPRIFSAVYSLFITAGIILLFVFYNVPRAKWSCVAGALILIPLGISGIVTTILNAVRE